MPETFSKSSTAVKGPLAVRKAIIRFAITGPIPSSESKSEAVARFILIGPRGTDAFEPARARDPAV